VRGEEAGHLGFYGLGEQRSRTIAQNLRQSIGKCSWLDELENVSVGHGVSLLQWRSGGVEHPHDTPPYPFMPSPTSANSSLGVVPCLEVLVDLPNYFTTLRGGASGFSDVAPAVKWQLNLPQSSFNLSITTGAALPTGASSLSGSGVQPYLQNSLVAGPW